MSIKIHGNQNKGPAEVDVNTLALYLGTRPADYTTLGSYAVGFSLSAAPGSWLNLITAAPVVAFQWTSPNAVALIRKITVSVGNSTAATAGLATLQMFPARGYTQQYNTLGYDSTINASAGGLRPIATNILLGNGNKLRSSMPPSQCAGLLESNSAFPVTGTGILQSNLPGANIVTVLSGYNVGFVSGGSLPGTGLAGGTLTLDSQPLASVSCSGTGTTGSAVIPPQTLYDAKMSEYPFVLDAFTGFVIQATLPGTNVSSNVYQLSFNILWDELATTY